MGDNLEAGLIESPCFLQLGDVIRQFAFSMVPPMSERDVEEVHVGANVSILGVPRDGGRESRGLGAWRLQLCCRPPSRQP